MALRIISIFLLIFCCTPCAWAAPIKVVATIPDLKDMVEKICGEDVVVDTLMVGPENHHAVPLKPSFLTKLSRCDILVLNGLEYEHAFLPGALLGVSNPKIQRGGPGYIDTSQYIRPCDVPSKIDLALGDLHPLGASHIHTDPRNGILQCKAIYEGMVRNFPDRADRWKVRYEGYVKEIYAKIQELKQYARGTEGLNLVFYHPGWCYLGNTFGWNNLGYIEVRAGIPPTPSHIQELITLVKGQKNVLFCIEVCYDLRVPEMVAQKCGNVKIIRVPHHVKAAPGADTYLQFIDTLVKRIADEGRKMMEGDAYGEPKRQRQRGSRQD